MPLGLKRYQEEGHLHFITFSCYRREPTLTPHYTLFEHTLESTRRRYNLDVHGYVLMPEHVHLLLSEPEKESLAKALQAHKLSGTKQIGAKQFWQPRYYDFNVFTARKRLEKLRYMHRNPVTRGLVAQPEDWPYSSHRHYVTGVPHPTLRLASPHS